MGTRSQIGILQEDGTVKGVYCHYDGYPAWNGAILLQHYNNLQAVNDLINGGSMSSLDKNIENVDYYANQKDRNYPQETVPYISKNVKDFINDFWVGGAEYYYLYKDNKWFISTGNTFVKLTNKKCKI